MKKRTIKVLVVDSCDTNRTSVCTVCDKIEGMRVVESCSAKEAIAIVREWLPHLVLIDATMPIMDGFTAMQRVKNEFPDTTVMVITNIANLHFHEALRRLGADDFIQKPVEKKALRSKLEEFANGHDDRTAKSTTPRSIYKPTHPSYNATRKIKTVFTIEDEGDASDLSLWIMQHNHMLNTVSVGCTRSNAALNALMSMFGVCFGSSESTKVAIEEDNEALYVSVKTQKEKMKMCKPRLDALQEDIGDDFKITEKMVHFRINRPQQTEADKERHDDLRQLSSDEHRLLRSSFADKTDAKEYCKSLGGVSDEVIDLHEIETAWLELLGDAAENPSRQIVIKIANTVNSYARVINNLLEFEAIGYALTALSSMLRTLEDENIISGGMVFNCLKSPLNDLIRWRNAVFVEQSATDIHYLDASLLSSFVQLDVMLSGKAVEHHESEIEFF